MIKSFLKHQIVLAAGLVLAFGHVFVLGCSTQKVQAPIAQELQTNSQGEVVRTKPLVANADIPKEFYEEIYPDYTRGITTAITVPASGKLSKEQLQEIEELLIQSKNSGAIHQISVLAWGNDNDNLEASAARSLEAVRVALVPHLEKSTALISSYNMEQDASWTARLFMSKQARMKSYFSKMDRSKMFSKVIIGVSTTDKQTYAHPEMVSL